ncbi:MAG: aminotransferase class I/II-fold pyridoxal phosphate-dependent enzyme [Bacteroidales bacterium]|nr:aminotransferase class I/II-fold pyridoxal phosphate-dependent enzyme [Bacteroidales bacterium]
MKSDEFRKRGYEIVDWISDYLDNIEDYPVKSQVKPGDIYLKLPEMPPLNGESMDVILKDFREIILPGITHWQSPNFFAYFPANTSGPSILAEMLTSALGTQCMIWETTPAAAELEERVLNWLRDITGLPKQFEGVIQDTASGATLAALVTAREKISGFKINKKGFRENKQLRVYCSKQTHSSVEKAVKIAGFGYENLIKVDVDANFAMDSNALLNIIKKDISDGNIPCCVVATIGTTGTTAIDPLKEIGEICNRFGIWLHVDAALAGTALILPEFSWMIEGKEYIDSLVFNPHKWMFTNFDCSAYFVRDAETLIKTFEVLPEYLRTRTRGEVNDYRDWGIPLGRRFRALKLWFVIRFYGIEGLRDKIRGHIAYAGEFAEMIKSDRLFELLAPAPLNTVAFRFNPGGYSEEELNSINEQLNHQLNDTGKIYLTHTSLDGKYVLRMVVGQTNVTIDHVRNAWSLIKEKSVEILEKGVYDS